MFIISPMRRYLKRKKASADQYIRLSYSWAEIGLYFIDTAKDIVNTVTPYKYSDQRRKDATRLFSGIANVLKGLFFILLTLFELTGNLFITMLSLILTPKELWAQGKAFLYAFLLTFTGGLVQTGRGLFQIISSPIALVQISWRSLLTAILPTKTFQGRESVQRLVAEVDALLESNQDIQPQSTHTMREIDSSISALLRKHQNSIEKSIPAKPVVQTHRTIETDKGRRDITLDATSLINNRNLSSPISAKHLNPYFFEWIDSFRKNHTAGEPTTLQHAYYCQKTDETLPNKNTCLRRAAYLGHTGNVRLLLQIYGADPLSISSKGKTAHQLATEQNHNDTAKAIEEHIDKHQQPAATLS